MKVINVFDLWTQNWDNAKRFFESKGSVHTRSKLKDKWYNEFAQMIKDITEVKS